MTGSGNKSLRRTGTDDPKTLALEDAAAQQSRDTSVAISQSLPDHIKNGTMLSGIKMTPNVPKAVAHGLGKVPNGASMMHCLASNPVAFGVTKMDKSNVTVVTNHTCTIDIWVY
jgi:hypothetical protein